MPKSIQIPSKTKILLVDDRPEGLVTLEAVLSGFNYELVKADSGLEALRQVLDDEFAVILLDVQMPGLDGFATAELIRKRERSRSTPIIFITAIDKDETYVFKGYAAGAVDYLFKPFDPQMLRAKVSVFVDLFQKNVQIQQQAEMLLEAEKRQRAQEIAQVELESLRRYQNLAESIPHIVWKSLPAGEIIFFNQLWYKYTGLTPEQSLGQGWQRAIQPNDLNLLLAHWDAAGTSGKSFDISCRIQRQDGKYRWHLFRVHPESNAEGRIAGWLGTNTDIQAFKDLDEQRANFLSLASHELKTPLTSIKVMLELLDRILNKKGSIEPDALRRFIDTGVKSADRLNGLLDDLLDYSRVESGRLGIEPKLSDLAEQVRDAVTTFLPALEFEGKHRLIFDIPPRLEGYWDVKRLRQVTDNLLGNAIKYSPEAGQIEVTLKQEGDNVIFEVKDQGIGIAPEDQERIFKPFERAVNTKNFGGFGIGLFVSARIIEQHQGRIEVRSEKGKGSVFTVRLPVQPETAVGL